MKGETLGEPRRLDALLAGFGPDPRLDSKLWPPLGTTGSVDLFWYFFEACHVIMPLASTTVGTSSRSTGTSTPLSIPYGIQG